MQRILVLVLFTIFSCETKAQSTTKPVPVIFDSDMGPDYDDVGAIAMLHAFADSGYIDILATIASTRYEGVAAVFNVFNTYFNRQGMPIGVPGNHALTLKDWQHWTDTVIAKYPHAIKNNSEAYNAIELYRKLLAQQPDQCVVIVTVGFTTNLADLLRSTPDSYSNLNGVDLVKKKVKRLVSMAGKFPSGGEFNVDRDAKSSQYVFITWPTEIIMSGFEIGVKVRSGLPLIANNKISKSPVKDVFSICIPKDKQDSLGRMSWDETAVLVAVKGYKDWYALKQGQMIIADNGANSWKEGSGNHFYLVEAAPHTIVEKIINKMIQHQPVVLKE